MPPTTPAPTFAPSLAASTSRPAIEDGDAWLAYPWADPSGRSRIGHAPRVATLSVLDAQALIAFLLDEPAAAEVEGELRDPTRTVWVSAINLAEVVDVMARIYRRSPAETLDALALLESGGLRVASVDADIGLDAGVLHAQHYDRKTSALSMADCGALATARILREPLATSDPALAAAARASGVAVLPLPDARGRRPA